MSYVREREHGQIVPTGEDLAKRLAKIMRKQSRVARAAVMRGRTPDLSAFQPELESLFTDMLGRYAMDGAMAMMKRIADKMEEKEPELAKAKSISRERYEAVIKASGRRSWRAVLGIAWNLLSRRVMDAVRKLSFRLAASTIETAVERCDDLLQEVRRAAIERRERIQRENEAAEAAGKPEAVQPLPVIPNRRRVAVELARTEIETGIREGEGIPQMSSRLAEIFSPERALMIAQTESSRAYHQGQIETAIESDVVGGLQWLASADACPKCKALQNKIVPLGEPFEVLNDGLGPYDIIDAPPRHPNCMCAALEVFKEDMPDQESEGDETIEAE